MMDSQWPIHSLLSFIAPVIYQSIEEWLRMFGWEAATTFWRCLISLGTMTGRWVRELKWATAIWECAKWSSFRWCGVPAASRIIWWRSCQQERRTSWASTSLISGVSRTCILRRQRHCGCRWWLSCDQRASWAVFDLARRPPLPAEIWWIRTLGWHSSTATAQTVHSTFRTFTFTIATIRTSTPAAWATGSGWPRASVFRCGWLSSTAHPTIPVSQWRLRTRSSGWTPCWLT